MISIIMHHILKKFLEKSKIMVVAALLLPLETFAADIARSSDKFSDFKSLVDYIIGSILGPLAKMLAGLAIVYFLYGASQYILHADESEKRAEGQKMMFAGIVAIAVMVSLWALVNIVVNTVNG